MSQLEQALERLNGAVAALLDASERGRAEQSTHEARISELETERDRLRDEVAELRAAREEDAKLRAEAAEAVKAALRDLRTLLAAQEQEDAPREGAAARGGRNA